MGNSCTKSNPVKCWKSSNKVCPSTETERIYPIERLPIKNRNTYKRCHCRNRLIYFSIRDHFWLKDEPDSSDDDDDVVMWLSGPFKKRKPTTGCLQKRKEDPKLTCSPKTDASCSNSGTGFNDSSKRLTVLAKRPQENSQVHKPSKDNGDSEILSLPTELSAKTLNKATPKDFISGAGDADVHAKSEVRNRDNDNTHKSQAVSEEQRKMSSYDDDVIWFTDSPENYKQMTNRSSRNSSNNKDLTTCRTVVRVDIDSGNAMTDTMEKSDRKVKNGKSPVHLLRKDSQDTESLLSSTDLSPQLITISHVQPSKKNKEASSSVKSNHQDARAKKLSKQADVLDNDGLANSQCSDDRGGVSLIEDKVYESEAQIISMEQETNSSDDDDVMWFDDSFKKHSKMLARGSIPSTDVTKLSNANEIGLATTDSDYELNNSGEISDRLVIPCQDKSQVDTMSTNRVDSELCSLSLNQSTEIPLIDNTNSVYKHVNAMQQSGRRELPNACNGETRANTSQNNKKQAGKQMEKQARDNVWENVSTMHEVYQEDIHSDVSSDVSCRAIEASSDKVLTDNEQNIVTSDDSFRKVESRASRDLHADKVCSIDDDSRANSDSDIGNSNHAVVSICHEVNAGSIDVEEGNPSCSSIYDSESDENSILTSVDSDRLSDCSLENDWSLETHQLAGTQGKTINAIQGIPNAQVCKDFSYSKALNATLNDAVRDSGISCNFDDDDVVWVLDSDLPGHEFLETAVACFYMDKEGDDQTMTVQLLNPTNCSSQQAAYYSKSMLEIDASNCNENAIHKLETIPLYQTFDGEKLNEAFNIGIHGAGDLEIDSDRYEKDNLQPEVASKSENQSPSVECEFGKTDGPDSARDDKAQEVNFSMKKTEDSDSNTRIREIYYGNNTVKSVNHGESEKVSKDSDERNDGAVVEKTYGDPELDATEKETGKEDKELQRVGYPTYGSFSMQDIISNPEGDGESDEPYEGELKVLVSPYQMKMAAADVTNQLPALNVAAARSSAMYSDDDDIGRCLNIEDDSDISEYKERGYTLVSTSNSENKNTNDASEKMLQERSVKENNEELLARKAMTKINGKIELVKESNEILYKTQQSFQDGENVIIDNIDYTDKATSRCRREYSPLLPTINEEEGSYPAVSGKSLTESEPMNGVELFIKENTALGVVNNEIHPKETIQSKLVRHVIKQISSTKVEEKDDSSQSGLDNGLANETEISIVGRHVYEYLLPDPIEKNSDQVLLNNNGHQGGGQPCMTDDNIGSEDSKDDITVPNVSENTNCERNNSSIENSVSLEGTASDLTNITIQSSIHLEHENLLSGGGQELISASETKKVNADYETTCPPHGNVKLSSWEVSPNNLSTVEVSECIIEENGDSDNGGKCNENIIQNQNDGDAVEENEYGINQEMEDLLQFIDSFMYQDLMPDAPFASAKSA